MSQGVSLSASGSRRPGAGAHGHQWLNLPFGGGFSHLQKWLRKCASNTVILVLQRGAKSSRGGGNPVSARTLPSEPHGVPSPFQRKMCLRLHLCGCLTFSPFVHLVLHFFVVWRVLFSPFSYPIACLCICDQFHLQTGKETFCILKKNPVFVSLVAIVNYTNSNILYLSFIYSWFVSGIDHPHADIFLSSNCLIGLHPVSKGSAVISSRKVIPCSSLSYPPSVDWETPQSSKHVGLCHFAFTKSDSLA